MSCMWVSNNRHIEIKQILHGVTETSAVCPISESVHCLQVLQTYGDKTDLTWSDRDVSSLPRFRVCALFYRFYRHIEIKQILHGVTETSAVCPISESVLCLQVLQIYRDITDLTWSDRDVSSLSHLRVCALFTGFTDIWR